jgi:ATP-dependent DNA ligase
LPQLDGDDLRSLPIETRKATLEGIVSKRLGSPYRSGLCDAWIKCKNPAAIAVQRERGAGWNR